ncbi:MAG: hypothetical protein HC853_16720 [Anaerolineae bacterium]|nr:hypothetical protein [Anaerolineae bacterium]
MKTKTALKATIAIRNSQRCPATAPKCLRLSHSSLTGFTSIIERKANSVSATKIISPHSGLPP